MVEPSPTAQTMHANAFKMRGWAESHSSDPTRKMSFRLRGWAESYGSKLSFSAGKQRSQKTLKPTWSMSYIAKQEVQKLNLFRQSIHVTKEIRVNRICLVSDLEHSLSVWPCGFLCIRNVNTSKPNFLCACQSALIMSSYRHTSCTPEIIFCCRESTRPEGIMHYLY